MSISRIVVGGVGGACARPRPAQAATKRTVIQKASSLEIMGLSFACGSNRKVKLLGYESVERGRFIFQFPNRSAPTGGQLASTAERFACRKDALAGVLKQVSVCWKCVSYICTALKIEEYARTDARAGRGEEAEKLAN